MDQIILVNTDNQEGYEVQYYALLKFTNNKQTIMYIYPIFLYGVLRYKISL